MANICSGCGRFIHNSDDVLCWYCMRPEQDDIIRNNEESVYTE